MDDFFQSDEKLYRAVQPQGLFGCKDGSLSSAAFLDKEGLSVDRGNYRPDEEAALYMLRNGLHGDIYKFSVKNCQEKQIIVKYKPENNDPFHSEIHGSEDKAVLTKGQRRYLVSVAEKVVVTE